MAETWAPIPGHEGYEASDLGQVRSVDRVSRGRKLKGCVLSPQRLPSRHLQVSLGRGKPKLVHHAVLEAFVEPRPPGKECRHLNGCSDDNRLVNLEWGTRADNNRDRTKHGQNTLSTEQVVELRRRYKPYCPVNGATAMAKELGVHRSVVYSAVWEQCYV